MKTVCGETHLRRLGEVLKQQDIIGEILLTERSMALLDIHYREVSKDINVSFSVSMFVFSILLLISSILKTGYKGALV